MVAMLVAEDPQVTEVVIFAVWPPGNIPVAVNCWVSPSGIEGFAGVTAIEVKPVSLPVPLRESVSGLP